MSKYIFILRFLLKARYWQFQIRRRCFARDNVFLVIISRRGLSQEMESSLYLQEISKLYPTIDAALSRIAALRAELAMPKATIHIVSDVHGEYKKLRHVINNASGTLKPIVEEMFKERLDKKAISRLLNLIYYPLEAYEAILSEIGSGEDQLKILHECLLYEFEIFQLLGRRRLLMDCEKVLPADYRKVFLEILFSSSGENLERYVETLVSHFHEQKKEVDLLRMVARVIRNLLISELIIAGDLGDRGPRIDKVINYIMHQPNVAITWGNHDASWLGACLGDRACIATVIRISLRYRRLSQLEEGYGIPMAPLEKLARTVYQDDPAERFPCRGEGMREASLMARMQKAIAVIQFKMEGQTVRRNPGFNMEDRNLLHRIIPQDFKIEIGGKKYQMRDTSFPTIDWSDPYKLSAEEEACIERLRESFLHSPVLWEHFRYIVNRGSMYLIRDRHLIFHACVPVTESGEFLELEVDGVRQSGKALFDALNTVIHRAIRHRDQKDLDMLWYLWAGPRSPWFGKDKMTTFEGYFLDEAETHHETKNPYFKLIHEKDFCKKVLSEFGVDPERGLIINGHVPVKIEKGESPIKKSGLAVTIDGAFSEVYGDKGYTLVLEPDRTFLAQHHHFESVEDAIQTGADIVPSIVELFRFDPPRKVIETERGSEIQEHINMLESLIKAFRANVVREKLIT